MLRFLTLALVAVPALAGAADRTVAIASFDRLRVNGPIEVRVATGGAASARVSGDAGAVERISVSIDGNTVTVRPNGASWGEQARPVASGAAVVTLTTPALAAVSSIAGAKVAVTRMKAPRIDLSLSGTGAIAVDRVDTDLLAATSIGSGAIAVGGRAAVARLAVNGPATIDAATLDANDLRATLDGNGEIRAGARYTATVNNLGLGRVTVAGKPKCTVASRSGGPVVCGVPGAAR